MKQEIYILVLKDPELVFSMIHHCHSAELHRHNSSMAAIPTTPKKRKDLGALYVAAGIWG